MKLHLEREKTRKGKRKEERWVCGQSSAEPCLEPFSPNGFLMKRLNLSYRSRPEVARVFLCHPRLLTVPEERWDPVLMRGLGPWPSWLPFSWDRKSRPAGAPCPLSAVKGQSSLSIPEPKKQKLSKFTAVEKHLPSLFLIKLPMLTLGLHSTV